LLFEEQGFQAIQMKADASMAIDPSKRLELMSFSEMMNKVLNPSRLA
jgi:hypothetical protein